MILYEKKRLDPKALVLEWWAVDVESLTLAHCRAKRGSRFSLRYVEWSKSADCVEIFPEKCNFSEAAINLLIGCREYHSHFPPCPALIKQISTNQTFIPEYIPLGSPDGPAEAILHTIEPVFVAVFPDGPRMVNARDHFVSYRLVKPLPTAGWEYWRTDAWDEFVRMADYPEPTNSRESLPPCQQHHDPF